MVIEPTPEVTTGLQASAAGVLLSRPMGQPIVVTEKPSVANPGLVRFETNRALSGMGHERYLAGTEVSGDRPVDVLARRMIDRGGVTAVHINGSVITVDIEKGRDTQGLKEIIETLYIYYPPEAHHAAAGTPSTAGPAAEPRDDAPTDAVVEEAGDAPEAAADPAEATDATTDDAPAPDVDEGVPPPPEETAAH